MASIEILKGPDGKEKEEINSNNEDRKYRTTTYIKSCNLTTELQKGKCVEALQNGRAMDGVTNEITSGSINSNSNIGNSDTGSGHREIFDLCDFLEKNKQKQTCCKTDVLSCYLWRFIRLATQVFLCVAVFFCLIVSKASFQIIANGINSQKDININRKNQHPSLTDIFVYELVICLMVPDIIKLVHGLCQLILYRKLRSKGSLIQTFENQEKLTVKEEEKKHWLKKYSYEIKRLCFEILQCNAMYIIALTIFPFLGPLEICAFSASSFFIPCVIRTLCERKDFRFKNNLCYIIYVAIYCLGFSGVALEIQYNSFTLNGRFYLILTSISMLLFGLKYLPLTDEQQKKGISNICLVIACASRILTAVLLTLYFYPNIGSIAFLVNEIKRNCGHHSNEGPMINQSHLQLVHNSSLSSQEINGLTKCIQYKLYIPFFLCIVTSYLCYHFAITACRLRMQQTSFALPISIALPCYVSFLIFVELDIITVPNFELVFKRHQKEIHVYLLLGSFALLWMCQLWSCKHIWKNQTEHLPETSRLFNFPNYFGPFNDISLMISRKQESSRIEPCKHTEESKSLLNNTSYDDVKKMRPKIFVCATMWHETLEEMKILLTSIFRLDYDHAIRRLDYKNEDDFDLDAHIFFDDAFESINGRGKKINSFVHTFHYAINEVARENHSVEARMKQVECITPYGCREVWTLPGKTKLTVHLKDKELIRNKKRWSQVMYFNYILKQKVIEISKDLNLDKQHVEDNIFILTLDGDVSFTPLDVRKIFVKMQESPKIGAVTGRLVPCGSGPIVWFQTFEYAMGHWLWKTAEHVFGSVLCAPGCFSLYRGSAILNKTVLNTYSRIPSTPREYLQFDQGEDRWLTTLLLKEGYRVEYIDDATVFTAAPENIPEFLKQRRRWTSSIIANLLELQECSKILRKRNSAISMIFIVYIFILVGITIFTPAAVLLWLIEVNLQSMTIVHPWVVYAVTYTPFLIHIFVCFKVKSKDTQHSVTSILTILYACVVFFIFIGHISVLIHKGVSRIWYLFLLPYLIPAFLHISHFHHLVYVGAFYVLSPLCYILVYTYSVCNLNDMSWGTREKKTNKVNNKNLLENNETILNIYHDIQSNNDKKHSFFKSLKSLIIIKLIESIHKTKFNDLTECDSTKKGETATPVGEVNFEETSNQKMNFLGKSEKEFWEILIKETLYPIKIEDITKNSLMKDFQLCRNRWVTGYVFLNCGILIFRKCLDVLKIKLDITILSFTFKPFGLLNIIIFGFVTLVQLTGLVIFKYRSFLENVSRSGAKTNRFSATKRKEYEEY